MTSKDQTLDSNTLKASCVAFQTPKSSEVYTYFGFSLTFNLLVGSQLGDNAPNILIHFVHVFIFFNFRRLRDHCISMKVQECSRVRCNVVVQMLIITNISQDVNFGTVDPSVVVVQLDSPAAPFLLVPPCRFSRPTGRYDSVCIKSWGIVCMPRMTFYFFVLMTLTFEGSQNDFTI